METDFSKLLIESFGPMGLFISFLFFISIKLWSKLEKYQNEVASFNKTIIDMQISNQKELFSAINKINEHNNQLNELCEYFKNFLVSQNSFKNNENKGRK